MNLQQITQELEEIKALCDEFDLTKSSKVTEIEQQGSNIINKTNRLTQSRGIEESALEDLISSYEKAQSKAKEYDSTDDEKKVSDFTQKHQYDEAGKVQNVIDARKTVQTTISQKYEELTRKLAIIQEYSKKFNPNEFKRQRRKKNII